MKPVRIQRKRTKGWRMPPNSVCVTRPGKWGNPFRAEQDDGGQWYCVACDGSLRIRKDSHTDAARAAVSLFRAYMNYSPENAGQIRDCSGAELLRAAREELCGKNLACFCALDKPCHADVLLELANPDRE